MRRNESHQGTALARWPARTRSSPARPQERAKACDVKSWIPQGSSELGDPAIGRSEVYLRHASYFTAICATSENCFPRREKPESLCKELHTMAMRLIK